MSAVVATLIEAALPKLPVIKWRILDSVAMRPPFFIFSFLLFFNSSCSFLPNLLEYSKTQKWWFLVTSPCSSYKCLCSTLPKRMCLQPLKAFWDRNMVVTSRDAGTHTRDGYKFPTNDLRKYSTDGFLESSSLHVCLCLAHNLPDNKKFHAIFLLMQNRIK